MGPNAINLGAAFPGPSVRATVYNTIIRSNGAVLSDGDADNILDGTATGWDTTQWQTNEYDNDGFHYININLKVLIQ